MNTNSPKVIFITGPPSAGKGKVTEFYIERNFSHYSVRAFLTDILKKRDLELSRENMKKLADELRKEFGPAYIIETLYEDSLLSCKNVIIESVRNPGEIEFLRSKPNTHLLGVDADQKKRYEWSLERGSSTDNVSFEKFKTDEEAESKGGDIWTQNLPLCLESADYIIHNIGGLDELYLQAADFLRIISESEEVGEKV